MKIVELDIGASGGKMLLGDYDGKVLKSEEIYRFDYANTFLNGRQYSNFLYMYDNFIKGLRKAATATGGTIESVSVDAFGDEFILLDRNDQLSFNEYSYNPTTSRFKGNMEELFKIVSARELHERTGCQNSGFNTLMMLFAYKRNKEQHRLDESNSFLFLPDAFNYFLTGSKHAEFSNANITSMVNRHTNNWDKEIFDRLELPFHLTTPIIQASTIVGETSATVKDEIGIKNLKVVTSASHDTAAAVFAVPDTDDNFGFISSGTWSLVGIETDRQIVNDYTFRYNIANEDNPEGRVKLLVNVYGLRLVQFCRQYYNKKGIEFEFGPVTEMAAKEPPLRCFFDVDSAFLAYDLNVPETIRRYCAETGQFVPESVAEVVRCINDSLALKYKYTFDRLERASGIKVPSIHVIGGGARNKLLCQLTANATGIPVFVGPYEAAGMGNLLNQLIAQGELKGCKEARKLVKRSIHVEEYVPRDQELWKEKYAVFSDKCMNGIE